jgi:hypothetical protein
MHTQTVTKTIKLLPNWKDNNFEGYAEYIAQANALQKTLASLFVNDDVEIVSLDTTISVTLKEKEQKETLDTSFWVDVATGEFNV